MLYTTYFGNLKKLPKDIIPISITRKPIKGWKGLEYKKLAPTWDILQLWKQDNDKEQYISKYNKLILNKLDPAEVIKEIYDLIGATRANISLICYEKPEDFCHRHLVAKWFNSHGYNCEEYNEATYKPLI